MTKEQTRRRKKIVRKTEFYAAWTLVYTAEMIAAFIPAAIVAHIAVPVAYQNRGYAAFGGEWLLVLLVFCVTYKAVHGWFCNKIFGEEKK